MSISRKYTATELTQEKNRHLEHKNDMQQAQSLDYRLRNTTFFNTNSNPSARKGTKRKLELDLPNDNENNHAHNDEPAPKKINTTIT